MNQFVVTAFKALGVLLLSAFIFFLFWPGKDEVKDQATDLALEFLGKRLLAMVPKEHEREVEDKFKTIHEQALQGRINDEHLNDFATLVINAEAAGEPLGIMKIDSALTALRQSEAAARADQKRRVQEAEKIKRWAQRVHEFEKFEKKWHTLVVDSVMRGVEVARARPFYRVSKNFVVQIDSAAFAYALATHVAAAVDSLPAIAATHAAHPPAPPVTVIMRDLENDFRDLRVEWRSENFDRQWADSMRAHAKALARERRELERSSSPPPLPPAPAAQPPPRRN